MNRAAPLWILVLLSGAAFLFFGYWSLIDFSHLQQNYAAFHGLAASGAPLQGLFVAESEQNIHRINVFADGTWAMLSLVIVAIGIHGLCLLPRDK